MQALAKAKKGATAQALQDLLRAVRVGLEPAYDLTLEGIEQTRARVTDTRPKLLDGGPLRDGLRMQPQGTRGLREREMLSFEAIVDAAEGLIVDHGAAPTGRVTAPDARAFRDRPRPRQATGRLRYATPAGRAPGRSAPDRRAAAARRAERGARSTSVPIWTGPAPKPKARRVEPRRSRGRG